MKQSVNLFFLFLLISMSHFAQSQDTPSSKGLSKKTNGFMSKALVSNTTAKTQELLDNNTEDENSRAQFKQALTAMEKALEQSPDNANINYKTGLCYYFSPDQQLKALPCFQKALAHFSANYDFNSLTEIGAPYSALYFLASTYLEAGKPDSALKYFSLYKEKNLASPINSDREIAMCYNAKESDKHLRNVQVKNIAGINTSYCEKNPVIKIDNSMLFFSSNRPAGSASTTTSEDIYISSKNTSGSWSAPEPFPFNTEYDEAPLFITVDGKTLYLRKTVKGNSDIYYSKFINGNWTQPQEFAEINSPSSENGFSMTADGKTLYFSSDRNKSIGKFDLYECKQDANGKWGSIQRLPKNINSAFNEISPFINPDGKTLFFSSDGYENKGTGGYDIYYCELKNDKSWTAPQSMGYPINSTRNDVNYYIGSGDKRYFSRLNGDKSYDLYTIEGGGFDFESISASTEVVTVTNETSVSQLLETEKEVEKEVEVTKSVETEVIKEKEVEVIKTVEAEVVKDKEVEVTKTVEGNKVDDVNLENLSQVERSALVEKVKSYMATQLKENETVNFKTLYFDVNQSKLSLPSKNELKLLLTFLKEHPDCKIQVVGNTDNSGSWENNLILSSDRAKVVYDYLLKNKVSPKRLSYYGRASAAPAVDNSTADNRSKNRRVEVLILK